MKETLKLLNLHFTEQNERVLRTEMPSFVLYRNLDNETRKVCKEKSQFLIPIFRPEVAWQQNPDVLHVKVNIVVKCCHYGCRFPHISNDSSDLTTDMPTRYHSTA